MQTMSCLFTAGCAELCKSYMNNVKFTFKSVHPPDKFIIQIITLDGKSNCLLSVP